MTKEERYFKRVKRMVVRNRYVVEGIGNLMTHFGISEDIDPELLLASVRVMNSFEKDLEKMEKDFRKEIRTIQKMRNTLGGKNG